MCTEKQRAPTLSRGERVPAERAGDGVRRCESCTRRTAAPPHPPSGKAGGHLLPMGEGRPPPRGCANDNARSQPPGTTSHFPLAGRSRFPSRRRRKYRVGVSCLASEDRPVTPSRSLRSLRSANFDLPSRGRLCAVPTNRRCCRTSAFRACRDDRPRRYRPSRSIIACAAAGLRTLAPAMKKR
jgi:hypothetical protein